MAKTEGKQKQTRRNKEQMKAAREAEAAGRGSQMKTRRTLLAISSFGKSRTKMERTRVCHSLRPQSALAGIASKTSKIERSMCFI